MNILDPVLLQFAGMLIAATAFIVGIRQKLGQIVQALKDINETLKDYGQRITLAERDIERLRWHTNFPKNGGLRGPTQSAG